MPVAPTIDEGVRAFASRLEAAGAVVEEAFPDIDVIAQLETYGALFWMEFSANVPAADADALADDFGAGPHAEETMGRGIHRVRNADARLYLQVLDERDRALRAWETFLAGYDAFLAPVSALPSIDNCPPGTPLEVDGKARPYWDTIGTHTVLFNLGGQPGVAMPCGFAEGGRPFGVQLVGPRWSDARLLDIAEAVVPAACPRYAWPEL